MSLLYLDGFDSYGASGDVTSEINKKAVASGSIIATTGKNNIGIQLNSSSDNYVTSFSPSSTMIVGFNFKSDATATTGNFFAFRDNSTQQVALSLDSSNQIEVRRNTTLLGTGSIALTAGQWFYIELKTTIDDSSGIAEVRVDGVVDIDLSSQDTQEAGSTINNILIAGDDNVLYFDDLYIADTSGSLNNDFLSPINVEALRPSGIGNSTEWSVTGESNNYEAVDDSVSDGDTTYVSTGTTGNIDTYEFDDLSSSDRKIFGLQTNIMQRKDDVGERTIRDVVRTGGNNYTGDNKFVTDDYMIQLEIKETNPNTTNIWTSNEINDAEFGVNLVLFVAGDGGLIIGGETTQYITGFVAGDSGLVIGGSSPTT